MAAPFETPGQHEPVLSMLLSMDLVRSAENETGSVDAHQIQLENDASSQPTRVAKAHLSQRLIAS